MDAERTRLRALYEGIAMPLSAAQTDTTAIEISDAEGVYLGSVDIDDNPLYDASEATEAHAALIVGAVNALPALLDALDAAEARATRADATLDDAWRRIVNLYAERNAARAERDDARAIVETLRAEAALMREIIEGRAVPPTDAEIAAHWRAQGGRWIVTTENSVDLDTLSPDSRDWWVRTGATRWLPVASDGRPCAWPTVTP